MLFASILLASSVLAGCAAGEASDAARRPARARGHDRGGRDSGASRVGRLHRPARSGRERRGAPPRRRLRRVRASSPKADASRRAICCFRSIRGRSRPRSTRLTAERDRARAEAGACAFVSRARRAAARAERDVARGVRAARSRRGGRRGAARRRRSGARRRAAESVVHARHGADRRPRVARDRHGRQPRRRRDAADDASSPTSPVYAYFDIDEQTYLEHVRGAERARDGSSCTSASSTSKAIRTPRGSTSSTTRSIPTTARSARARCSTTRTGDSRRACSCA